MKTKVLVFFITALFAINFQTNAQESTSILLEKAQAKAKKEGKSIFIKFEASWCGWCHKMTNNMKAESTKKFFDDNFVLVPIVVFENGDKKKLENPGAEDLIKKYNNGKSNVGLPFWFVLDTDLKIVMDSYNSKKANLGCPATPEEIKEFVVKLKTIVSGFSKADEAMITKQFTLK